MDARSASSGPCEAVLLHKQGLDLRLKEFQEQKKRIEEVHRRLSRKWDDKVLESILSFDHDLNSYAQPLRDVLWTQTKQLKRFYEV